MSDRLDTSAIGAAGVHYLAWVLSMRGFIALETVKNTRGVDLVVVDPWTSRTLLLQVKTSCRGVSFWPVGKRPSVVPRNVHFVFIRNLNVGRPESVEVFLESADRVYAQADQNKASCDNRLVKSVYCWGLPLKEADRLRVSRKWANLKPNAPLTSEADGEGELRASDRGISEEHCDGD